tara:strand:+ start:9072 stop:12089 length:3018 start_codon:yes stop_codon:yes gene_type:complete
MTSRFSGAVMNMSPPKEKKKTSRFDGAVMYLSGPNPNTVEPTAMPSVLQDQFAQDDQRIMQDQSAEMQQQDAFSQIRQNVEQDLLGAVSSNVQGDVSNQPVKSAEQMLEGDYLGRVLPGWLAAPLISAAESISNIPSTLSASFGDEQSKERLKESKKQMSGLKEEYPIGTTIGELGADVASMAVPIGGAYKLGATATKAAGEATTFAGNIANMVRNFAAPSVTGVGDVAYQKAKEGESLDESFTPQNILEGVTYGLAGDSIGGAVSLLAKGIGKVFKSFSGKNPEGHLVDVDGNPTAELKSVLEKNEVTQKEFLKIVKNVANSESDMGGLSKTVKKAIAKDVPSYSASEAKLEASLQRKGLEAVEENSIVMDQKLVDKVRALGVPKKDIPIGVMYKDEVRNIFADLAKKPGSESAEKLNKFASLIEENTKLRFKEEKDLSTLVESVAKRIGKKEKELLADIKSLSGDDLSEVTQKAKVRMDKDISDIKDIEKVGYDTFAEKVSGDSVADYKPLLDTLNKKLAEYGPKGTDDAITEARFRSLEGFYSTIKDDLEKNIIHHGEDPTSNFKTLTAFRKKVGQEFEKNKKDFGDADASKLAKVYKEIDDIQTEAIGGKDSPLYEELRELHNLSKSRFDLQNKITKSLGKNYAETDAAPRIIKAVEKLRTKPEELKNVLKPYSEEERSKVVMGALESKFGGDKQKGLVDYLDDLGDTGRAALKKNMSDDDYVKMKDAYDWQKTYDKFKTPIVEALGEDYIKKDLAPKVMAAINDIYEKPEVFKNLMKAFSEEERKTIVMSALGHKFTQNGDIDPKNIVNYFNSLKPKQLRMIEKTVGKENFTFLNGVKDVMENYLSIIKKPKMRDKYTDVKDYLADMQTHWGKLVGAFKNSGWNTLGAISTSFWALGTLGFSTAIPFIYLVGKTFRNVKNIKKAQPNLENVIDKALNNPNTRKMFKAINTGDYKEAQRFADMFKKSTQYKNWLDSQTLTNKKLIRKVGLLNYLTDNEDDK